METLLVAPTVYPIQDPRGRREQGGPGVRSPGAPSYTLETHPPGVAVIPFDTTQITHSESRSRPSHGDPAPTLARGAHAPAIAFHQTQDPIGGEVSPALGRTSIGMGVAAEAAVRRLTPRECERLMGMPDDWTAIPGADDGPRYAAIGNAIAIPVLRWIGRRIDRVEHVLAGTA